MSTELTATQKAWIQPFVISDKLTMRPIDVKRLLNLEHVSINETVLFLNKCKQYGADPFLNDLHMIKYSAKATAAIVTGVGFFQKRAAANPNFQGYVPTVWLTKEMEWVDVWIPSVHGKNPLACKVGCRMKGWPDVQTFVVNWEENFKNSNPWKTMGSRMLEKNGIVGLLRSVLPSELGGLYISEEINGEEIPAVKATVTEPYHKDPKNQISPTLKVTEGKDSFGKDKAPEEKKAVKNEDELQSYEKPEFNQTAIVTFKCSTCNNMIEQGNFEAHSSKCLEEKLEAEAQAVADSMSGQVEPSEATNAMADYNQTPNTERASGMPSQTQRDAIELPDENMF